jgi:hypothetical protein
MAILIELEPAEMQDSITFSRNAELIAIGVSSASFCAPNPLLQKPAESLSTGIKFSPKEAALLDESMRASTSFEYIIRRTAKQKEADILVRIECVLTATYQIRPGYTPSQSELAAFHKANVVFNCWPYFREFVQNASSRMNIPPPPVPFVRVQVHRETKSKELSEKSRGKALKGKSRVIN